MNSAHANGPVIENAALVKSSLNQTIGRLSALIVRIEDEEARGHLQWKTLVEVAEKSGNPGAAATLRRVAAKCALEMKETS